MLADDAELVRLYLRLLLQQVPSIRIVHEAQDVPEAIEGYDRIAPDVLILDLQMPSGTGMDVLRHVRSRGGNCTVIILSGTMDERWTALCRQAGADHCFHKATEFEKVRQVIAELCAVRAGNQPN